MSFKTYDVRAGVLVVGGVPMTGFADGTAIRVEFDEEQFTKTTGADGLTTRSKTNNYAGSVSIFLQQTSPSNDVLSALWATDRATSKGVVPVMWKDFSGRTIWAAQHAWVRQMTSLEEGKEASDREWVLDCAELTGFTGGN